MANDLPFLDPEAAVRVLEEEHGVIRRPGTLRKLRCTGGGPQFAKFGRQILYRRDWLAEWVRDQVSQPMLSTSGVTPAAPNGALAGTRLATAVSPLQKKLRLRVHELALPPRVLGALASDGITCLGQLVQLTETDLMGMPNVGRISIARIKTTLAKHRLRLGMEIAPVPEAGEKNFKEESRAARRRTRR
jgi:Bacterial RNA polymerase, alpha chain C terminal domain